MYCLQQVTAGDVSSPDFRGCGGVPPHLRMKTQFMKTRPSQTISLHKNHSHSPSISIPSHKARTIIQTLTLFAPSKNVFSIFTPNPTPVGHLTIPFSAFSDELSHSTGISAFPLNS